MARSTCSSSAPGSVEAVPGLTLSPKSLEVAVRNIARRLGGRHLGRKASPRLPLAGRQPGRRCRAAVQLARRNTHDPQVQCKALRDRRPDPRLAQSPKNSPAFWKRRSSSRQNILISGGTGTGKTTLLNILAHLIPEHERILIIEDTAEIQISAPNLVRFEARVAQNGFSAVTIRELLKASLRHRPDRILLGEIRGAEAFDLLQLLNTGHSGTISTVHANSALQAINRFTSCVLQSNVELPYRAIKSNIADSLNLLVHIERRPGRRFVSEVSGNRRVQLRHRPLRPQASFFARREQ